MFNRGVRDLLRSLRCTLTHRHRWQRFDWQEYPLGKFRYIRCPKCETTWKRWQGF